MKIAILLETNFTGGGGPYVHSINTCIDLKKYCGKKNDIIVYTQFLGTFRALKKLKIPAKLFSYSLMDKILLQLSSFLFFRYLTTKINFKTSLEKSLLENKNDLIFFPVLSNFVFCLKKIKFVSSILDLEHFKHSIFPEINKKEFKYRENIYYYSIKNSQLIITSCESIKDNICRHYFVNKKKVFVIPYTPSAFATKKKPSIEFLNKFKKIKNYFFYPARIFGHKNHITILRAVKILNKKNIKVNLVFSGNDRGYKRILDNYIEKNKIKWVNFTGFLSSGEMHHIYKSCKGVVFTTLWGPNAIPPLETWSYKKPLIYNDRLEDDVRQGTALIGNIKDPKFIANSIEKILKNRYKKSFILNGYNRLQLIKKNSKRCYINLNKKLSFLI
ncbi:glycosyltransferase [Candidatus Pelagibacter sp.]|nr:glycosyltransferase [Candidatus Pelagibacter sp.]